MSDRDELTQAVHEMLRELLAAYEERVPAQSKFPDLRSGRRVTFGDRSTSMPGRIELAVMHMDAGIDSKYDSLRFLAVRVWKSTEGGMASTTCFHETKDKLKQELEEQLHDASYILDRIEELAHGLPEQTNPNIWR